MTNGTTFDRIAFVIERHLKHAAVAQAVERRIGSAEVTGPIPVSSFVKSSGNLEKIKISAIFLCLKTCRQLQTDKGKIVIERGKKTIL